MNNKHLLEHFYVISVITNPERFKTRARLFREFMERMERDKIKLYVVEAAFGDREFEVTDPNNPCHIQLRTESEVWHKENLINIGISRLPRDWKYVAWVDGDIHFVRPDWALETVHELQHTPIVQMFTDALDMGPDHEVLTLFKGFAYCYKNGLPRKPTNEPARKTEDTTILVNDVVNPESVKIVTPVQSTTHSKPSDCDIDVSKDTIFDYYPTSAGHGTIETSPATYWHPGYAWAATREAINTLGGLLEIGIVGAGDHHMSCCFIGEGEKSIPSKLHDNYKQGVLAWQQRALRLHKNIGYVKNTIHHFWHGKKRCRKYKERWEILLSNNFNPITDIYKDWQGVLTLHPSNIKLRDEIRVYFQSRNEDSIDK